MRYAIILKETTEPGYEWLDEYIYADSAEAAANEYLLAYGLPIDVQLRAVEDPEKTDA